MRLRNIPGADEAIADSPHCIQEPMAEKGCWHLIFGNENPIHIEIGMGKGQFIMQLAKEHPDINYIGIERYSSVLLRALQKMEIEPLPNIRFLCMDASIITEVFDEEEVAKIYLNFSDPWPKERHAKRRLTHGNFLKLYRQVLKMGGQIHFKTDNDKLFCLRIDTVIAMGGSQSYAKIFSVDKKSGKQITLKNLFKKGSGYIDRISDNIKEQMRAQMKENADVTYFVDDENNKFNFKSISNKTNCYVNEKGELTLVFDKYEVAPGYMGMVEFSIPTGEIVDMVTNGYLK